MGKTKKGGYILEFFLSNLIFPIHQAKRNVPIAHDAYA